MKKILLCLLTINTVGCAMEEPGRDWVDRTFSFCSFEGLDDEVDREIIALARDHSREALEQMAEGLAAPHGITLDNVRSREEGESEQVSEAKSQICHILIARSLNGRWALDAAEAARNAQQNNHDVDERKEN